jgi:hypothetical protein
MTKPTPPRADNRWTADVIARAKGKRPASGARPENPIKMARVRTQMVAAAIVAQMKPALPLPGWPPPIDTAPKATPKGPPEP